MGPRVLMLHGLLRNAEWFQGRLRALQDSLAHSGVELVFVNAPHIKHYPSIRPSAIELTANTPAVRDPSTNPIDIARCWWLAENENNIEGRTYGVNESLAFLRKVMVEQGPFDGVVGFSMGASLAALLCSLVEDPTRHPIFAQPGKNWPPPQLKFAVMASGFLCQDQDPIIREALSHELQTPALLLFGAGDTLVPDYGFFDLIDTFANKRVEWQEGGHYFPTKPKWTTFISEYLQAGLDPVKRDAIPSPGGARYARVRLAPPAPEVEEVTVEAASAEDNFPLTEALSEALVEVKEEEDNRLKDRKESEKKLTETKVEVGWAKRTFSRVRRSATRLSWSGDKRQSFVVEARIH